MGEPVEELSAGEERAEGPRICTDGNGSDRSARGTGFEAMRQIRKENAAERRVWDCADFGGGESEKCRRTSGEKREKRRRRGGEEREKSGRRAATDFPR